jgi:hypothetical protein
MRPKFNHPIAQSQPNMKDTKAMSRTILVLATVALLSACGGRYAGFDNCSADGSVVVTEYPNAAGTYEGLNNGPCK